MNFIKLSPFRTINLDRVELIVVMPSNKFNADSYVLFHLTDSVEKVVMTPELAKALDCVLGI
tara:strand:- start:203 stop:388 length:186 start_codon:yes stop_codon:yes gene_type:complete